MNQTVPGPEPDCALLRSLCDPAADDRALDTGIDAEAIELAANAKMLALLAHRARRTRAAHPADVRRVLAEALQRAERRSVLQRAAAVEVSAALTHAGIATAVLNGTALNGRLYPYPTRPGSDVDLLITPGAIPVALEVLDRLGYREPARTETARRRRTGDSLLPHLTVDLADHLGHTGDPDQVRAALALAAARPEAPELPTLAARDEFSHTLARAAARPRWLTYADALRLALAAPTHPDLLGLPEPARTGWKYVAERWPVLLRDAPGAKP